MRFEDFLKHYASFDICINGDKNFSNTRTEYDFSGSSTRFFKFILDQDIDTEKSAFSITAQ